MPDFSPELFAHHRKKVLISCFHFILQSSGVWVSFVLLPPSLIMLLKEKNWLKNIRRDSICDFKQSKRWSLDKYNFNGNAHWAEGKGVRPGLEHTAPWAEQHF